MHTKQGLSSVILAIIIAAVLLGSGYVAYQKYQQPTADNRQQEQDAANADASDWKTYHNEEYGFEFKYPPTWYHSGGSRDSTQYLICLNPNGASGDCTGLLTVNWDVSLQERYSATKSMLMKNYPVNESEVLVDGAKGRLLTIGNPQGYTRSVFWERNYLFNFQMSSGHEALSDQILSTFKFTK